MMNGKLGGTPGETMKKRGSKGDYSRENMTGRVMGGRIVRDRISK